jgi:Flp pilus assembly pilin Flp
MKELISKVFIHIRGLREDHGQDLIEYALTAALIALATTAGMGSVANAINTAFSSVGTILSTYSS